MEPNAPMAVARNRTGSRLGWWIIGGCAVLVLLFFCCMCTALVFVWGIRTSGPRGELPALPTLAPAVTVPPTGAAEEPASSLTPGSSISQVAPDFALRDLDGRTWHLGELRGHPVVINFWATWCPPCRQEMPVLEESWQRYQAQGLVILAVDLDESQDQVAAFAGRSQLTLPILVGARGDSLGQAYRVYALPTTYFVDKDGIIQGYMFGAMARRDMERNLGKIGVTP